MKTTALFTFSLLLLLLFRCGAPTPPAAQPVSTLPETRPDSASIDLDTLQASYDNDSNLPRIEDDFVYDFMNTFLLKDTASDPREWRKMGLRVSPWYNHQIDQEDLVTLLDSIKGLSEQDKAYMMAQVDSTPQQWDANRINRVVFLPRQVIKNIFEIGRGNIKTDSALIVYDAWDSFRRVYGNYGLHHYSKPLYNPSKTTVVVIHEGQGDWTLGSGEIYVFQKEKEGWELVKELSLWIS